MADVIDIVKREPPRVIRGDLKFRFEILDILNSAFCTKVRFVRILEKIKSLMEGFNKMSEKHSRVIESVDAYLSCQLIRVAWG